MKRKEIMEVLKSLSTENSPLGDLAKDLLEDPQFNRIDEGEEIEFIENLSAIHGSHLEGPVKALLKILQN